MPDIMDCTCDSIVGNSFIANVNLLASQFGTLQNILNVPDEVKNSVDQIKEIEFTIDAIAKNVEDLKNDAARSASQSETYSVNAGNIREETKEVHVKTMDVLERCRKFLGEIRCEIARFEGDKVLAEGISNGESLFTCPKDVCPGSVMTIKGFRYPVGRNTLLVSCDGVEFYRWVHFEEVGPKGAISSMVKINVPVNKGSVLKFYNISSSMSESAFQKAKELKCELDQMHRKINKDVADVLKAKEYIHDAVLQVNMLKSETKGYVDRYLGCCNGVLVISDPNDIPDQDCLFIVNPLLPRVPAIKPGCCKPCVSNKRPLFSEGSICGTIAEYRGNNMNYDSGCFDVTYNGGRC